MPRGASVLVDSVSLLYGSGAEAVTALRDVSFEIEPGESVAVIGPSGCGKSTLLHMMAGLLAPTSGTVLVAGATVEGPRRATAFIPQDLGLFPWKTVLDNAALGLVLHGVPKQEALAQARKALADVGLSEFERRFPKDLSGGMRQRLALARALALDADLLLMDEPLSAIDALLRESLQDTLLALHRERGHTQVLVTHSIEEAVYLGQRIVVFSERPGTVVAQLENMQMGDSSYRESPEFSAMCRTVRAVLGRSGAPEGEAREAEAREGEACEAEVPEGERA